jgi:hypothetical protein
MKDNRRIDCRFLVIILISISSFSQTKNILKDSITNRPIAYANIWVQNENIGVSSEENGEFSIPIHDKNKKLVFSAMGYEKKITKINTGETVFLKPIYNELKEVVIIKKFETKRLEIGEVDSAIRTAMENGPKVDLKYFPYLVSYKKTKYIQKVSILTDCRPETAMIKIHFYKVDSQGLPTEDLFQKDFIVTVKQGINKHFFDVSDFNFTIPKNGVFVAFEKLIIEKNKIERTIKNPTSNVVKTQILYAPFVLYNVVEKESALMFSNGNWIKKTPEKSSKLTVYEPVINLVLSN